MAVHINIHLGFGFGPDVVLTVLVRVVGLVGFALLLLQFGEFVVDVILVPGVVVVLNGGGVADQVDALLCGLFLLLLF